MAKLKSTIMMTAKMDDLFKAFLKTLKKVERMGMDESVRLASGEALFLKMLIDCEEALKRLERYRSFDLDRGWSEFEKKMIHGGNSGQEKSLRVRDRWMSLS